MKLSRMPCPECGQLIRTTRRAILWHLLNRWHDPISAAVNLHRIGGEPIWRIVLLAGSAFAVSMSAFYFFTRWLAS